MDILPDNSILKKRLSTYRTDKGYLKNVSDELLIDILIAWESWPDTASSFYSSIGTSYRQMATLMSKAKKLKRTGMVVDEEFKELKLEPSQKSSCQGSITMRWDKGKVIRFPDVDHLVDFLKKVA